MTTSGLEADVGDGAGVVRGTEILDEGRLGALGHPVEHMDSKPCCTPTPAASMPMGPAPVTSTERGS